MYFMIFCVNSNLAWIDNKRPVSEQFDQIAQYKMHTKPADLCCKGSRFLHKIVKYVYKLGFTEEPDYNKMRFMLQKVLMDINHVPAQKFDWSFKEGEGFKKNREDDKHSSVSSQGIPDEDQPPDDECGQFNNIKCIPIKYTRKKKLNHVKM